MIKSFALAAFLPMIVMLTACATRPSAQAEAAVDSIYVMRHLQKADGEDPPLSAEGKANAQRLAGLLRDKGITAIFATDTVRARQTAEPLSAQTGIAIQIYDPRDNDALARRVAALPGSVLIVGHSNTVPAIVTALHGTAPPPLSESDFGEILVIARADGRTTHFML